MKKFLSSKKGKIMAGIITIVIIAIILIAIFLGNKGYRTIAVEELNGITRIVNSGANSEAFVGMHFKKGDDVTVTEESDLTMSLDLDKYLFARENTHFWIEASGKNADTRTTIHLDEGSVLCRIDNKLGDAGSFDIETPNATMSVRGTVFRVEVYTDASGLQYTVVDVLEGQVFSQVKLESGQNTEENRVLNTGESAIVHSDPSFSEFIKAEDLAGYLDGEGKYFVEEIDFAKYSKNEALFLGKAIDAGRVLCISKELLFDIVGLTDHDFSIRGEEVLATCTKEGYYYDICAICGLESEKHIIDKIEHDFDDEMICKVCGKEEAQVIAEKEAEEELQNTENTTEETVAKEDPCANGHTMEKTVVNATCTADGYEESVCSICGYKGARTELKATGHNYVESTVAATCEDTGMIYHTCSFCTDAWVDYTPALGHSWEHNHSDATCTSDGYDSETCNRCGAGTYNTIPATGHSPGGYHMIDVNTHGQTCGNCGATINVQSHSFDASAICTVCHWG